MIVSGDPQRLKEIADKMVADFEKSEEKSKNFWFWAGLPFAVILGIGEEPSPFTDDFWKSYF